ncbi:hypothetical protein GPECTOR_1121g394 [Gonium pectorale]|uniref:Uncharacterized protein n=1 Tax=Gonium pectorale TaxID=33097 RepID=A0A150FUV8_GONPE|nr:hypothetical protein GPECTOR_1121g394 [Gonium pectorale]|eukprot:KXZ40965.1 hypothetical protein GPECTOR_1121g394 [Gonium pectorale]
MVTAFASIRLSVLSLEHRLQHQPSSFLRVQSDEWFPRISEIAANAEVAWNNQRYAAASAVSTQPGTAPVSLSSASPAPAASAAPPKAARVSSSTSQGQSASASTGASSAKPARARFWCNSHGWNASHATEQCKRGQAVLATAGAASGFDQLKGLIEQCLAERGYGSTGAAAATASVPATKWQADRGRRQAQQQPSQQQQPRQQQQQGGAGGSGEARSRCDYCSRLHTWVCFIRNPELAPPNYKAPAGVLQAAFDNNLAAYRVRQGTQPAQQPAKPAQQPAAAVTVAEQMYDQFYEELYAPAQPALITCHEAVSSEAAWDSDERPQGARAACATLKQQQVPVSFTPAPIPEMKFVMPKAQRAPSATAKGGGDSVISTLVLGVPLSLSGDSEFAAKLRGEAIVALGGVLPAASPEKSEDEGVAAPGSPGAVQPPSGNSEPEPAAAATAASNEPAMQCSAANGVKYYVCGDPQGAFNSITNLSQERKLQLLAANKEARDYFNTEPHMFYYSEDSLNLNLITERLARRLGLPMRPASASRGRGTPYACP